MQLVLLVKNFFGEVIEVMAVTEGRTYSVGRSADCDLVIDHNGIANRQLEIEIGSDRLFVRGTSPKGRCQIVSLASENREVSFGKEPSILHPDSLEKIKVGESRYIHCQAVATIDSDIDVSSTPAPKSTLPRKLNPRFDSCFAPMSDLAHRAHGGFKMHSCNGHQVRR